MKTEQTASEIQTRIANLTRKSSIIEQKKLVLIGPSIPFGEILKFFSSPNDIPFYFFGNKFGNEDGYGYFSHKERATFKGYPLLFSVIKTEMQIIDPTKIDEAEEYEVYAQIPDLGCAIRGAKLLLENQIRRNHEATSTDPHSAIQHAIRTFDFFARNVEC